MNMRDMRAFFGRVKLFHTLAGRRSHRVLRGAGKA